MTTNAALRTRRCGIGARPSVRRFDASPCPAPNRRHSGTPTSKSAARSNSKRRRCFIADSVSDAVLSPGVSGRLLPIRFRHGRSFTLDCRFHDSHSLINPGDQTMTPANSSLSRSAAIPTWLAAAVLAASLFAASPIAHADDYEDCMIDCIANGGSTRGCHDVCE